MDYERLMVEDPAREVTVPAGDVKGRDFPTRTYMSRDLVPEASTYIEMGWIKGMPDPNPHIPEHAHNKYDEIVMHIGSDPNNPGDLGGEIEYGLGGQKLTIDKTSAIYHPKGIKHGPVTWKKFERPHIQMTMMLGAGTLEEAQPGVGGL